MELSLQWNLLITDTFGTSYFVHCRDVALFQRLFCIVFMQWYFPLYGGLSSFRVSVIGGSTVRLQVDLSTSAHGSNVVLVNQN